MPNSSSDAETKWTVEQENLLAEWCEKAACYRWLHDCAQKRYKSFSYALSLPVIILSTLTGTANFGVSSIIPDSASGEGGIQVADVTLIIGSLNLIAGIISTLQNFLRFSEGTESHRASSVQWSKFQRNIAVELAISRKDRIDPLEFINTQRSEYDRLIEQSPAIPDIIIKRFIEIFNESNIKKPDICDGITKCQIYTESVNESQSSTNKISEIVSKAAKLFKDKTNIFNSKSHSNNDSSLQDYVPNPFLSKRKRDKIKKKLVESLSDTSEQEQKIINKIINSKRESDHETDNEIVTEGDIIIDTPPVENSEDGNNN